MTSDENSVRATPTAKAMCWYQWLGATSRVRVCVRVRGHAGYHKSLGGAFAHPAPAHPEPRAIVADTGPGMAPFTPAAVSETGAVAHPKSGGSR